MHLTQKELRLHTLRGDIQQIGIEANYNERDIRAVLEQRYVNPGLNITQDEFDRILSEEYKKVEAWHARQKKGYYGKVVRGDGKEVTVYVPSKEEDE